MRFEIAETLAKLALVLRDDRVKRRIRKPRRIKHERVNTKANTLGRPSRREERNKIERRSRGVKCMLDDLDREGPLEREVSLKSS